MCVIVPQFSTDANDPKWIAFNSFKTLTELFFTSLEMKADFLSSSTGTKTIATPKGHYGIFFSQIALISSPSKNSRRHQFPSPVLHQGENCTAHSGHLLPILQGLFCSCVSFPTVSGASVETIFMTNCKIAANSIAAISAILLAIQYLSNSQSSLCTFSTFRSISAWHSQAMFPKKIAFSVFT